VFQAGGRENSREEASRPSAALALAALRSGAVESAAPPPAALPTCTAQRVGGSAKRIGGRRRSEKPPSSTPEGSGMGADGLSASSGIVSHCRVFSASGRETTKMGEAPVRLPPPAPLAPFKASGARETTTRPPGALLVVVGQSRKAVSIGGAPPRSAPVSPYSSARCTRQAKAFAPESAMRSVAEVSSAEKGVGATSRVNAPQTVARRTSLARPGGTRTVYVPLPRASPEPAAKPHSVPIFVATAAVRDYLKRRRAQLSEETTASSSQRFCGPF
jgi:hypothetical protein